MKKYQVTLTPEERQQLSELIAAGKAAAIADWGLRNAD